MDLLATLAPTSACLPNAPPFLPTFPINGQQAAGYTFSPNLAAYDYSDTFKDLIWECLYEDPNDRPALEDVRSRIAQAIDTILGQDDTMMEPWEDFLPPEPQDPPVNAPPPPPPPVGAPAPVIPPPPPGGAPAPPANFRPRLPAGPPPVLALRARSALCLCTRLTPTGVQCKNKRRIPLPCPPRFDCGVHRVRMM